HEMRNNDPSHDWLHVNRVVRLVQTIAKEEKYEGDWELLTLSAIMHDVGDWKYAAGGDERAGVNAVEAFLTSHDYPLDKTKRVCHIVNDVSFKNELSRPSDYIFSQESKIVQDADRLDAIGAIGIARTFAYGATKCSPFYGDASFGQSINTTLTKEDYMKRSTQKQPVVDHFYDKLFKLRDLMKTGTGRRLAESRHQAMVEFIQQMRDEVDDGTNPPGDT
ncbi:hypothetical protein SAMD00019534_098600, partial [Acytostelium subglobosum LB1]|uniref:hypothetical protein n=1 Tax=Acytostelium subglobosum LB1 TaxID=1410327 RepID=UPI000644B3E1